MNHKSEVIKTQSPHLLPCWTDHMFWGSDILVQVSNCEEDWTEKEGDLENYLSKVVKKIILTFFQWAIVSSFITWPPPLRTEVRERARAGRDKRRFILKETIFSF